MGGLFKLWSVWYSRPGVLCRSKVWLAIQRNVREGISVEKLHCPFEEGYYAAKDGEQYAALKWCVSLLFMWGSESDDGKVGGRIGVQRYCLQPPRYVEQQSIAGVKSL